ncbi:hypothetical protein BDW66DRAFT_31114 [Aspergillus desertorum]
MNRLSNSPRTSHSGTILSSRLDPRPLYNTLIFLPLLSSSCLGHAGREMIPRYFFIFCALDLFLMIRLSKVEGPDGYPRDDLQFSFYTKVMTIEVPAFPTGGPILLLIFHFVSLARLRCLVMVVL